MAKPLRRWGAREEFDMGDDADRDGVSEDEHLISELRRLAAAIDPVPDLVRAAAHAAISTRHLDRELVVLVADSAADNADVDRDLYTAFEPVRTASPGRPTSRLLTFATGGLQVDLEVTELGDVLELIGQVTGVPIADCVLEYANGRRLAIEVDGLGRFMATATEHGAVRARFRSTAGDQVMTAWVTL
jgi:hypothetical protein